MTCDRIWYVDKEMCKVAGLEELSYIHDKKLDKKVEGICPRYLPEEYKSIQATCKMKYREHKAKMEKKTKVMKKPKNLKNC